VETSSVGVGVDFIDDGGDRLFLYSITVGKFTYVWESEILPDNILVPDFAAILGIENVGEIASDILGVTVPST